MQLIPTNHKLPPLYSQDGKPHNEIKVPVKLFNPCGSHTWYLTEYDPENKMAFGYVTGTQFPEMGYISIAEIEEANKTRRFKIERDLHWNRNTTLNTITDPIKEKAKFENLAQEFQ